MNKLTKLLLISLLVSLVLTFSIILLPNSINNYYDNPAIYDTGFNYYLWKFRPIDASMIARITGWTFFILHFFSVLVLLKLSKNVKNNEDGYSKYNIYLLVTNVFFILLHYVHTWVWYDALAQDTPVWSSQGSVIIMLVLILIMENARRGLFFGKKIPFPKESLKVVMKNHGVYISLAIIFTFWYHPMEFTWGHLFGFFYMFMLMIQMSLAGTKMHNNMYWKIVLEVTVLFHGTFVAIDQDNAPWAMFLFGFAFIFFATQIYGLNLSKKTIRISQISFLVAVLLIYSGLFTSYTIGDVNEVIRIPAIEYLLVFVFVYLIYLPIWINKKINIPSWINKTMAVVLIIVLSLSAGMVIFSSSPYQPVPEIDELVQLEDYVTKTETSGAIVYAPESYSINIVFIPGGKVVPEAYSYLASELANNGFKVTIVKPLLNLAILSPNQANKYVEEDKTNVVMGHSLGGIVASMTASNNSDFDYLIMMGSYNTSPIKDQKTLAITAEFDSLDMETYHKAMDTVDNLTEEYILGGNHAYFGFYGEQKGDGEAIISNKFQQDYVVHLITQYLIS